MTELLSTGAAEAQAERELGTLFAGGSLELTPEAAPEAAPVVDPAAPAVEADGANVQLAPAVPLTPAVPEGGANIPGASTSPTPLDDPAVKKALGIYGDDPVAAAKGFLDTNTNNAKLAAKLRELGYDPKTFQPLPQEQRQRVEQTPSGPIQLDEVTVKTGISQLLNQDPDFNKLVEVYASNDARLSQVRSESTKLDDVVKQAQLALTIPEIKADTYKSDEYQAVLARAEARKLQLSLEESIIEGKQERLNSHARARSEAARTAVVTHYTQEAQAKAEEVELATAQLQARAEMATSWPLAIERAIKEHSIPQDLQEDFKEETRIAGMAHLARDNASPINDPFSFVANRAKELMGRYDRYHRSKSAAYGTQAQARTAVATTSSPAPVVDTQSPRVPMPSLMQAQSDLEKEAFLVGRQMGMW